MFLWQAYHILHNNQNINARPLHVSGIILFEVALRDCKYTL
jgi:hypothetical protein